MLTWTQILILRKANANGTANAKPNANFSVNDDVNVNAITNNATSGKS